MSPWLGMRIEGVLAVAAWTVLLTQGLPQVAHAQARLDARFSASLAGVPIGRGAWVVDIGRDKFVAAASGSTAGLLRIFSSGEGTGASSGVIVNGRFAPTSFASSITAGHKTDEVRMALSGGVIKKLTVTPPVKPNPGRVEVTANHRRGVVDPMTASLFRAATADNPLVPALCDRTASIFDGRLRYDVQYAFKRRDHVKAVKGYVGPVIVCSAYFYPIAGHVPDRMAIKYLTKLRDMEIWLAPIAGTDVVVPFRLSVPTPIGLGVVEATQFETQLRNPKPTPTSAQAQH